MAESLPDFEEGLSGQITGPLRTATTFIAAYISTAELTPKRDLETIALTARKTGTDFAGLVLSILSQLKKDLPSEEQEECAEALKLGTQASILFNIGDDEDDHVIVQMMMSCYAAMLDAELRRNSEF